MSAVGTQKTEIDLFVDSLDAEIEESMKDPGYAAAWRRIELREATWGLDKRQARRVRRHFGKPADQGGA